VWQQRQEHMGKRDDFVVTKRPRYLSGGSQHFATGWRPVNSQGILARKTEGSEQRLNETEILPKPPASPNRGGLQRKTVLQAVTLVKRIDCTARPQVQSVPGADCEMKGNDSRHRETPRRCNAHHQKRRPQPVGRCARS